MKKFLFLFFSFFVFFSTIGISQAKAISISNPAKVLEDFNEEMVDKVSDKFLEKPFLRYDSSTSIVRTIFYICFLIVLFGAFKDFGTPSMMPKLFELGMYSVIVLALLGESSSYSALSSLGFQNGIEATGSLDRDIYKHLKKGFDGAAKDIFKGEDSSKLWEVTLMSTLFTDRMIRAQADCDYPETEVALQKSCFVDFIERGEHVKKEVPSKETSLNPLQMLVDYYERIFQYLARLTNPFVWFFPLLFWLVKLATSIVNIFLVLGYGLASAVTLFFAKLVIPLLLLPSQRGAVMKGLKTPLSITLWGFLMQLIIFMAIAFTEALNGAAKGAALKAIGDGGFDMVALGTILGAMIVIQLVIMLFPLVAMFKIPKLAEDLLNFSVSSVISFGQDMIAATGGIAKMAAGLAMPAASFIGGAVGGAAGALAPSATKALSGLGSAAKGIGSKVLGEKAMSSLASKASSLGSSAKDGLGKVQSFRDKFSDIANGNQNSGLSRATQQSVKKSFENFSNSQQSMGGDSSKISSQKGNNASTGGGKKGGGSDSGGGGSSRWDALKQAGTSGVTQLGDLAITSVTGGPAGAASAVSAQLGSGAAALGTGLVAGGQLMKESGDKLKNIQNHLLRSKVATEDQKRVAQEKVQAATAPKRELNSEGLKSVQSIQRKIASGETLTDKDSQALFDLQSSQLNQEQAASVSTALNQRYDQALLEAQESGNYDEVLRLSNNEYANDILRKKDEINARNLDAYKRIKEKLEKETHNLQLKGSDNGNSVETLEAQAKLAEMASLGQIRQSKLNEGIYSSSYGDVASIKERSIFQKNQQDLKEIDSLLNKTTKTSIDYNRMKALSDSQKFNIKDESLSKKIEDSLSESGIKYSFSEAKSKSLDLGRAAEHISEDQTKNIETSSSFKMGESEFKINKDGTLDKDTFVNIENKKVSFKKMNQDDRNSLDEQIELYDNYLTKLDNLKMENPEMANQFEEKAAKVRTMRDYLREIKSEVYQNKKK